MLLVKEIRARSTKSLVQLYDMGNSKETKLDGGRWQTICVDHSNCVNHDKRINANYYLSHPEIWCDDCK